MKICFENKDPETALEDLQAALLGRKLGDMISFDLDHSQLRVTIKKMGKSTLEFSGQSNGGGTDWELTSEKIALAHRAFKDEMLEKLGKIIDSVGGQLIQ